jgi:hypothetical protein
MDGRTKLKLVSFRSRRQNGATISKLCGCYCQSSM